MYAHSTCVEYDYQVNKSTYVAMNQHVVTYFIIHGY